jgi:ribonuclease D
MTKQPSERARSHLDVVTPSSMGIGHSSLPSRLIASGGELAALIEQVAAVHRVAVDIEADSLHSYREKLCLLQISLPPAVGTADARVRDFIIDPLADLDLAPLRAALEHPEIVLHGADYDLRMLRRSLNLIARKIFDTVIAARLLGIREFGLGALVKRYFGVELPKSSQKANWAKRPLPARMADYAINDVHYLLPLARELKAELEQLQRLDWLRQSCQHAIEQAAIERERDLDEVWRIPGTGALRGRAAAVLRALWRWREQEAAMVNRPAFHVLRNRELLEAAVGFAEGNVPDYKHFSARRRRTFREAGQSALQSPESEWPQSPRRFGRRPGAVILRRAEELRQRRDRSARELGLEPSFIASRSALGAIAADETCAATLLVPWQRHLLGLAA